MPDLPAGMTWEDSGKRTDVKKGRYCSPPLSHHSSCCLVLLLAQRCEPSCQALQCLLVQLHRRMPCNDEVGLRTMLLCRFSAQEKERIERAVREYAAACDLPTDDLSWVIGVRKGVAPSTVCGRWCSRTPGASGRTQSLHRPLLRGMRPAHQPAVEPGLTSMPCSRSPPALPQ